MDAAKIEARFAETDALIAEMDERLRRIAAQNAAMADMVEVLGGYVNVGLEALQQHLDDPEAHR